MKRIVLLFLLAFVRIVFAFVQSMLIVVLYFSGIGLCIAAFFDQPPWFSVPMIIAGLIIIYIGSWISEADIPTPAWWKNITNSFG